MEKQTPLFGEKVEWLKDVQFMTAAEKMKVLQQWELFLKSGLNKDKFTKDLYHHLIQHCSFIAHYDLNGFYSTYFDEGDDTINFLSQFDNRNGIPKSIEYGYGSWYTDPDYHDINSAMCRVAARYIPGLIEQAKKKQRKMDFTLAEGLLRKHGINIKLD
jgi:hypothetical protein